MGDPLYDGVSVGDLVVTAIARGGERTADGATHASVGASGSMWRICMQIFTSGSASWTVLMICRWAWASASVDSFAPSPPPSTFGEIPPVMISPTPPRARAAKKAAGEGRRSGRLRAPYASIP